MSYLPVFIFRIIIFVIAISSLKNPNLVLQSSESAFAIIQIWQQGSWRFFFPQCILSSPHPLSPIEYFFIIIYDTKRCRPSYLLLCMHFQFYAKRFLSSFFLSLILFFNRFLDVFYVIPRRVLQTEIDMLVLSDALTLVFFFLVWYH